MKSFFSIYLRIILDLGAFFSSKAAEIVAPAVIAKKNELDL